MRIGALVKRHGLDALIVADAIGAQVEIWVAPVPGPKAGLVLDAALATLPLLARRRAPFVSALCPFAALAVLTFLDRTALSHTHGGLFSFFVAYWVLGALRDRRQALAGAAIGFAAVLVAVEREPQLAIGTAVNAFVLGMAVWLVAFALQKRDQREDELEERAARLEREREEQARAAVAEERIRIARELHDVIAHCVSVMTVQAGAARMLLDDEPQRAREPLLAVEETGRQALAEMRQLLGILRKDAAEHRLEPQPGMADLDALLQRCGRAGLPVELTIEGNPELLAPGVDLAAYRVVQEALTNAIKHAGPARASVTVHYGRRGLDLEIADDGRGSQGGDGRGHGLVGMRERVALYGGEFEAGPRPAGGYAVRAHLPLEPRS